MTLILTAITRRSVIQVADMRLTNVHTGKVEDETTTKMVVYAGRFVLSFAGPASMGREPTARWMTRVLSGVQDPGEILGALGESAERIVRRYPPNIRGLAIVGAGWSGEPEQLTPTYVQLTNYDFESGALLPRFQASRVELNPNEKVLLLSAGVPVSDTVVDEVQQLMRRRAGRREERPAEFIAMMVRLARSVAIGQRTVGTRFLVASIPGVRRSEGPPLFTTGIAMPTGRSDWHQVTDLDHGQMPAGSRESSKVYRGTESLGAEPAGSKRENQAAHPALRKRDVVVGTRADLRRESAGPSEPLVGSRASGPGSRARRDEASDHGGC